MRGMRERTLHVFAKAVKIAKLLEALFVGRVVGIGCVDFGIRNDQHQSLGPTFGRGIQGRNHDSERTICRCVSFTIWL